ncbi:MAG: diguanylate cyclase [Actinobacteria bacterium]|nr:diguanylate cyclase [Actinomycetota bacterium]
MSLRVRLTVYFSVVVVLPLAVAVITARVVLVDELERRAADEIGLGLQAVSQQVELIASRAGDVAEDLSSPERGLGTALANDDRSALQDALDGMLRDRERADVVVVAAPQGQLLASTRVDPTSPSDAAFPSAEELAELAAVGRDSPFVVGEVRTVQDTGGRTLGAIMAGRWVDADLAEELAGSLPVEVTLFVGQRPVGSTGDQVADAGATESPREQVRAVEDSSMVRAVDLGGWTAVASRSQEAIDAARSLITLASIGVLLAAGLAAALLGWLFSQVVVRPVRELAEAASDVASGDLDRRFEVEGRDEMAQLGAALNGMTATLRDQVRELEVSRDALQHSLDRLGDTLSSTLDLNKTLTAVVDASSSALTAERAVLYMLAPGRSWLYVKVARGLRPSVVDARVPVGEGLAGWVAQTGSSVRLPQDADRVPEPLEREAAGETVVAVPLFSPDRGQIIGVLELLDRGDGEPFDEADLHTLRSFAVQAAVAIENVRLHEATQQASVTDGLTGLWNLRYFQQRADEEVERAERFGHALSLAILDIDHFKSVNDQHGHLVGDQVLVDVARRVSGEVREVDTVARYGGEEIVIVLPETDLNGARLTAERIRNAVSAEPIETDAGPVRVTVSLGVAGYPMHGRSAAELLQAADKAMYAAKESGRDRVEARRLDAIERSPTVGH